jgi:DNA polymerase-4
MASNRRILHLDLDSFFCAVEEIRDPTLKGFPFAVGGRPEERGVVASCSYVARTYGIRSATPMARAIKLCPQLIIIPGHYKEYAKFSSSVMEFAHNLSQFVEQISIDEAFIDITDIPSPVEEIATQLQRQINNELDLPCSIGVASNKLVAKIATETAKATSRDKDKPPNAIQVVESGFEAAFLAPMPVQMLWGVGPKTSQKLVESGFSTIGDLAQATEVNLIELFGKFGHELSRQAKGIDERPIITNRTLKSISQETTFPSDVSDPVQLNQIIESLSGEVSKRLSARHLEGKTIKIKIRLPDFTLINRQLTLNQPTNQRDPITTAASRLFNQVWKSGQPIRLIGVGVSGVTPQQLSLWDIESQNRLDEKEIKKLAAVSTLRERFGEKIIFQGNEFNK